MCCCCMHSMRFKMRYILLHVYTCTRADYSSSSPFLYCKLRNACAYVWSHAFTGEGVAPRGYMWFAPPALNCCRRLCIMHHFVVQSTLLCDLVGQQVECTSLVWRRGGWNHVQGNRKWDGPSNILFSLSTCI